MTKRVMKGVGAGDGVDVSAYRRLALAMPGAVESSHMGAPDFRTGAGSAGRIFATLAYGHTGLGTLMLTPTQQAMFVAEAPEYFSAVPGGWGRAGATLVRLDAPEDVLAGALSTAYQAALSKQAVRTSRVKRPAPKKKG